MASKDFFLSPDDAQTMGDINFMRKSVQVRHTFPKNLKNPNGFAVTKNVSSIADNSTNSFQVSNQNTFVDKIADTTSQPNSISSSKSLNSASSNSMDLFRNMARNIGKR